MTDNLKKEIQNLSEGISKNTDDKVAPSKLDEVSETLQKLKEANDAVEKELLRKEELRAKIALGGKSQAGQAIPEKTKQEIADEEAKKILSMYK